MNKELLEEFIIKQYDSDYVVHATEKAYELLGLKSKTMILSNGYELDSISDQCYRIAFLNFLANTYRIDGLVRVSSGNSHDASWQSEVYIFKDAFELEELKAYRNQKKGLYVDSPIIYQKDKIDDDIIEEWANEYDLSGNGEDRRFVFCSSDDDSRHFCFSFDYCNCVGTASGKKRIMKSFGSRFYLKCEIMKFK